MNTAPDRAGHSDAAAQTPVLAPLQLPPLLAAGKLSQFDVAFAELVRRHGGLADTDGEAPDLLAFVAAVVCARSGRQDVFVDVARLQQEDPLELGAAAVYPAADELLDVLQRTHAVRCVDLGSAGAADALDRPLVLFGTRVYLARQFDHERSVAAALLARAAAPAKWSGVTTAPDGQGNTPAELALLFATTPGEDVNWQRVAAAMVLTRGLTVITGGPGTGKTTTVTRALVLLAQQQPDLRIALAAPTGKAAARLGEAVRNAKADLQRALPPAAAPALERVPEQGTTLHRLLRFSPLDNRFYYHAANLLPLDVLVIDEASMLDLRLARAALSALPAHARLLLVGDKDQLSSVDAGMVLGDVCAGLSTHYERARFSAEAAASLSALIGQTLAPLAAEHVPPMADCLAWLRFSHRFQAGGAIAQLADAINAGDVAALQAAFADQAVAGDDASVQQRVPDQHAIVGLACARYGPMLRCAQTGDAAGALALLNGFRVLCAVREGRDGVLEINRAVAAALGEARPYREAPQAQLYAGLPLLVTRNDARSGLFNGDVGVVVRQPDGTLLVAFPGAGDAAAQQASAGAAVRLLAPSRLPSWEPVFAMTIHKSQGSEFDRVAVVLPRAPSANEARLLTRELLYTAVTRARTHVHVFATPAVLAVALRTQTQRASGLRDLLWAPLKG